MGQDVMHNAQLLLSNRNTQLNFFHTVAGRSLDQVPLEPGKINCTKHTKQPLCLQESRAIEGAGWRHQPGTSLFCLQCTRAPSPGPFLVGQISFVYILVAGSLGGLLDSHCKKKLGAITS